jgi:hypothetical protein
MPRIFDNIEQQLLPALRDALGVSDRADFCVGYFNLRGWKSIDSIIESWPGGDGRQCRLLIGMQRLAQEELRQAYSLIPQGEEMSNQAVIRLKRRLAADFRAQLCLYRVPVMLDSGFADSGKMLQLQTHEAAGRSTFPSTGGRRPIPFPKTKAENSCLPHRGQRS